MEFLCNRSRTQSLAALLEISALVQTKPQNAVPEGLCGSAYWRYVLIAAAKANLRPNAGVGRDCFCRKGRWRFRLKSRYLHKYRRIRCLINGPIKRAILIDFSDVANTLGISLVVAHSSLP
jgi:hypothetical protein